MKNRPRLLKKLTRDSIVLIARKLYREPEYEVTYNEDKVYIDRIYKDQTLGPMLVINISIW